MDETDTQATGTVAPSDATTTAPEDTATTQASEASELSQGTPEATQDTKDSEVTATDTAQEERLFAGKYKSVEEMEKAYKELESKHGQTASEKAELSRLLNEAFLPAEPATQESDYGYSDDTATAPEEDSTKRDLSVLKFSISHPDADGEAMKKILAEDPMIQKVQGYDAKLEWAYLKSSSMQRPKAIAEAQKKGEQQAQVKAAEKEIARVESASKTEPVDEDSELRTQATRGNPTERKAARLAIIKKSLINL